MKETNKKWALAQQMKEVQVKVFGLKPNEGNITLATFTDDNNWQTMYNTKTLSSSNTEEEAYNYIKDQINNESHPVVIGVHHTNRTSSSPGNSNKATYHFMVVIGYGNDESGRYILFYDPGRSDDNRLYIKDSFIKGSYRNKTYTITQILKYY